MSDETTTPDVPAAGAGREESPAGRIAREVAGKPTQALCAVRALDLLTVCLGIPKPSETEVTRAQGRGSAIAIRGMNEHAAADVVVHVAAKDLREVLEVAGDRA